MATPNLNLTHLTASQNNKETTANLVFDGLDNAMNLSDPMTITGDKNVTAAELRGAVLFNLTGSPGATFVLTVPTSIERLFIVYNNTDQTCSLELEDAGTDGISITSGSAVLVHTNGTALVAVAGGTSTGGGGSGTTGITIQDEGATLSALIETLDFVGGGVQAYLNSDETVTIYVPSAVSGSGVTIEDEGTQLSTLIETLNFVGSGVTAYLNSDETVDIVVPGSGTATITINEDGALVSNTVNTLDFSGAGVDLFENSDGSITVSIAGATSAVPTAGFIGFRYTNNAVQAIGNFVPEEIDYQTEIFNTTGAGTFASNRWTVPADLDGKYMEFAVGLKLDANESGAFTIDVDTGESGGFVSIAQGGIITQDGNPLTSGPVLLNEGDVYRVELNMSTGNVADDDLNYFSGYVVTGNDTIATEITPETTHFVLTAADFDGNQVKKVNSGTAVSVFVPDDLNVTEPVTIIQEGAGQVTIVPDGSGVTLKSAGSLLSTTSQYSSLAIIPDQDAGDGNTYWVIGDLA